MDKSHPGFFLLLAIVLLFGGCATQHAAPRSPSSAQAAVQDEYEAAARRYLKQADDAQYSAQQQQQFRLQAAEALSHIDQPERVLQLAASIQPQLLSPEDSLNLRLLQARAWTDSHNAERVLAVLDVPPDTGTGNEAFAEFHGLRARAYEQLGNHLEAAHEYSQRSPYLYNDAALLENQQALWNELTQLSAPALRALRPASAPDEFSGWMALAEISKHYQLDQSEIRQQLAAWRADYPLHPAEQSLIDGMLKRSGELVLQPKRIALLLPLSGRFASAGNAIRDGIFTAYYRSPDAQQIELQLYDTADPMQAPIAYAQAEQAGADFVIGPLNKESVAALLEREHFPIPTLLLNSADLPLPDKVYQLSLSPEGETEQVANQAWQRGYSRAAVLVPKGEWGERIAHAFTESWQNLGGQIAGQAVYDASQSDHAQILRRLLGIDLSEARKQQLQSVLKRKLNFEPRRRQDIDFVFLAAFPRQARLLRPQLKFHRASRLPVLATSHIYSGTPVPAQDSDMDGILFGDMPWTLGTETPNQALRADSRALPGSDPALQRLLALGIDSFHLIPLIKVLETYPFEHFQGETGALTLNADRQFTRQLEWAQFISGSPRVQPSASSTRD